MAFVLLALVTGFFGLFRGFSGWAWVFSQGILAWYSMDALTRASNGDLRFANPDFSDLEDIKRPMRLGVAALLIASAPLIVVSLALVGSAVADTNDLIALSKKPADAPEIDSRRPSAAATKARREALEREFRRRGVSSKELELPEPTDAEDPDDAKREDAEVPTDLPAGAPPRAGLGAVAVVALLCSLAWKAVVLPAALIVAGVTRSFLSTVFPLSALAIINRMGATFWKAALVFTALSISQEIAIAVVSLIPFGAYAIRPFIDAYVALASGCVLGMAVHARSEELGFG